MHILTEALKLLRKNHEQNITKKSGMAYVTSAIRKLYISTFTYDWRDGAGATKKKDSLGIGSGSIPIGGRRSIDLLRTSTTHTTTIHMTQLNLHFYN